MPLWELEPEYHSHYALVKMCKLWHYPCLARYTELIQLPIGWQYKINVFTLVPGDPTKQNPPLNPFSIGDKKGL